MSATFFPLSALPSAPLDKHRYCWMHGVSNLLNSALLLLLDLAPAKGVFIAVVRVSAKQCGQQTCIASKGCKGLSSAAALTYQYQHSSRSCICQSFLGSEVVCAQSQHAHERTSANRFLQLLHRHCCAYFLHMYINQDIDSQ